MRYLLDTNIASDMLRYPDGRPARRHRALGRGSASISVIVAAELRFGARKKGDARLSLRVDEFLGSLDVLPFESPADAFYATVRSDLESMGRVISANDMFIAAHALALDRILVTDNERDFGRIESLQIENWLR